jgi:hypothetical protein
MPFYNNINVAGSLNSNHIYYNISVQNNGSGTDISSNGIPTEVASNGQELIYTFNESRAAPYLARPCDYFLSVVRFTIDSPNLPVFIPVPIVGQSNVNKTIYTVTIMGASNIPYKESVIWIPDNKYIPVPPGPVTQKMISPSSPYYYCYSYQHFVDCINIALAAAATAAGITSAAGGPPYIYFDANTRLFQLGGALSLYRTKTDGDILAPGTHNIFFNVPLLNLLSSLPAKYVAGKVTVAGPNDNKQMDYKMILSTGSDIAGLTGQPYITNVRRRPFPTAPIPNQNDVFAIQEYSTLSLWSPVTAILFKTTLLMTAPENMSTPIVYQNNNQDINETSQNAEILNILVDHYAPLTDGTEYKPYIYYEPTGEYKLTDLYGREPVDAIDIQVYWRDSFGNLVPFYLGLGCSSTLKILFRKKIFNSDKI